MREVTNMKVVGHIQRGVATAVREMGRAAALLTLVGGGLIWFTPCLRLLPAMLQGEAQLDQINLIIQRETLEKEARRQPQNAEVAAQLALACFNLFEADQAFRSYERAIALDPQNPTYHRDLAEAMLSFRKEAAAYYRCDYKDVPALSFAESWKALDIDPQNRKLAREFAQSIYQYRVDGAEDTAIEAWRRVRDLSEAEQDVKEAHLHLSRWLMRKGAYGPARAHLRRAQGYQETGLLEMTTASLERAIEINGERHPRSHGRKRPFLRKARPQDLSSFAVDQRYVA